MKRRRRNSMLPPSGGQEKCDFCSERPVQWQYPCRTFEVPDPPMVPLPIRGRSVGAWAACQTCHDLIEDNNWRGMLRRWESVSETSKLLRNAMSVSGEDRETIRARLRAWVQGFWSMFRANRLGPVQRAGPFG